MLLFLFASGAAPAWVAAQGITAVPRLNTSTSQPTATGCPGGNGIHISVSSGDSSSSADGAAGIDRIVDDRQSLDTTIVFNVTQKSWTRTNLAAALSVGIADEQRGSYSICAGVTALMPSATLTIRGARGRVHFAASLKELLDAIRLGPGAQSPQPRRL